MRESKIWRIMPSGDDRQLIRLTKQNWLALAGFVIGQKSIPRSPDNERTS